MSYRRIIPPFLGLLAVLVTACPGSKNQASARSFLSGTQLYSACNSEDDTRWGECIGFINGVADILSEYSGYHEQIVCFSYEKARDHLKDTVVFWLEPQASPHFGKSQSNQCHSDFAKLLIFLAK
jgi:hypothetical protein